MSSESSISEPRIVVGVDGSPSSKAALHWALRQSGLTGATVDAVIAWQMPAVPTAYAVGPVLVEEEGDFEEAAGKTLEAVINDVAEPADSPRVRTRVIRGNPAHVLVDAAADADLLVVGSRGHSALASALLGSVSQHCVHHAHCPILVMRDVQAGELHARKEQPMADHVIEALDEEACRKLIAPGGIGRIAYVGRYGPAVLPVNYELQGGAVVFRAAEHGPFDDDLRTGIVGADYQVAFEIDSIDPGARQGWSVLVQGPAHHVTGDEQDLADGARVETWAPGDRDMVVRIVPSRITGRRIGPA